MSAPHAPLMAIWRLALRDLRGGMGAAWVLVLSLALGVAAIAGVGSTVRAINAALEAEGRALLGGDLQGELSYRRATAAERAALAAHGPLSEVIHFRAMVGRGDQRSVSQLRAVDDAYPLVGTIVLDPPQPLAQALARDEHGRWGLVSEPALAARLGLTPGDDVTLSGQKFRYAGSIIRQSDATAGGFQLGPRSLIALAASEELQLLREGALFTSAYRLVVANAAAVQKQLETALSESGFKWRDHRNGAPGVRRMLNRIGNFLTLIGLASLAVGGVGVAAATRAWVDRKIRAIATLRAVGTSGRSITLIYLTQILVLALVGVGLGLVLGAAAPPLLAPMFAEALPVGAKIGLYPLALGEAAAYGLLMALAFALWPLSRVQRVRAGHLYREAIENPRALPPLTWATSIALLAMAVIVLAMWRTKAAELTLAVAAGTLGALALLALMAQGLRPLARDLAARVRAVPLRLALAGIAAPGAATATALAALGLGLTVLVAVGQIDTSLRRAVVDELPKHAPAFFALDIPADQRIPLTNALTEVGATSIELAPMMRGFITAVKGVPAEKVQADPAARWVLSGDRGLTYAATPPAGVKISEGSWWPADYRGPPLVSFAEAEGRALGLKIGDQITVNVLGRSLTATVTSFRPVIWQGMGINFVMIFDPATLSRAPHMHIATIYAPPTAEGALIRTAAQAFPMVTLINVREAVETAAALMARVAAAARGAAIMTLLVGLVVLFGAASAQRAANQHEAALLKALGGRLVDIRRMFWLRALLIGLAAALVAIVAGSLAAWGVLYFVLDLPLVLSASAMAGALAGGILASLLAQSLNLREALRLSPMAVLRVND